MSQLQTKDQRREGIRLLEELCKANPATLDYIKTLCFWSVQYASRVECERPNQLINKKLIDDYVEIEFDLKNVAYYLNLWNANK